jgi:hypothetical protein
LPEIALHVQTAQANRAGRHAVIPCGELGEIAALQRQLSGECVARCLCAAFEPDLRPPGQLTRDVPQANTASFGMQHNSGSDDHITADKHGAHGHIEITRYDQPLVRRAGG